MNCHIHFKINRPYIQSKLYLIDLQILQYAGINGWLNPRLAKEILHNRTVNLRGGLGRNIAMERVCEFLNDDFKGKT